MQFYWVAIVWGEGGGAELGTLSCIKKSAVGGPQDLSKGQIC
jgi:hypothetical protein